jgi:hypothetical protein
VIYWAFSAGAGRTLGALFSLIVALLIRLAPYPYWYGRISELLEGIRDGHMENYSLSVADCPGMFSWSPIPRIRRVINAKLLIFLGYNLDSLREYRNGFTAQLNLAGPPCNAFGNDILNLSIQVTYETVSRCVCVSLVTCAHSLRPDDRLHVNIFDQSARQFTLPSGYFDLPKPGNLSSLADADLQFNYEATPFAFWITRRSDPGSAPIFDTRLASLPSAPIPAFRRTSDPSLVFDGFPLVLEDRYLQV